MSWNWKSYLTNVLCILIILLFSSCSFQNNGSIMQPNFSITIPEFKSGHYDNCCEIGGIFFDFYNKSESSVEKIVICTNVYDKKTGKNAFSGKGTIVSELVCNIPSKTKRSLCIPLDNYITVISEAGYIFDQFYVQTVEYSDGTQWHDYFGIHAVGSE